MHALAAQLRCAQGPAGLAADGSHVMQDNAAEPQLRAAAEACGREGWQAVGARIHWAQAPGELYQSPL